ncbi:MAG: NADH-quinone oxidoreductase subunit E [Acidimicrobiales bacterium]|nr:NADH-quinone oxidoreductase subunit E [Acidimicrobiales bacterium]
MADLYFSDDQPTAAEAAAVESVLGGERAVTVETERLVRAGTRRRQRLRHLLLPALHALQREAGLISPGGLNHVCRQLQVPPAEAYGVATFYELFRVPEPGSDQAREGAGSVTHMCVDAPCRLQPDYEKRLAMLEQAGEAVHRSPCLGQCDAPPGVFIQGRAEPDVVPQKAGRASQFATVQVRDRLLNRVGGIDPTSIESHAEHGGWRALDAAYAMGADAVIQAVTDSGLSGRGGAAFPTGVKWAAVRDAVAGRGSQGGPPAKHIVANADESEPGTFKDRVVMENDPFSIIEAMAVAGYATGADEGWIYIRGEYPLATDRIRTAIEQSMTAGRIGPDAPHPFTIEVRRGAGAYICGEETALFNSIEGFRGEPRNKPPFPTTNGLFDQPTAINNPETLLNVLPILLEGPDAYRAVGTDRSPGTRLFCLSGRVARPGLYEMPFGVTLRQLLELADGVIDADGQPAELQAVLLGGAAGVFADAASLDVPLTLEDTREAGLTMGSGVVMVFDASVDMADVCRRIAQFFRNESCGQCVPCRVGAVRQHEMLVHIGSGPASAEQRSLHDEMNRAMVDAAICGLGHTAGSAVTSALNLGLIG